MSDRKRGYSVQKVKETADRTTGELIIETTEIYSKVEAEDPFVKFYQASITAQTIRNYTIAELALIAEIVNRVGFDNMVLLPGSTKAEIAKAMALQSSNFVNVCLARLVKKDFLKKVGNGEYMVNPNIYAKGSWKEVREKRLKYKHNKFKDEAEVKPKLRAVPST